MTRYIHNKSGRELDAVEPNSMFGGSAEKLLVKKDAGQRLWQAGTMGTNWTDWECHDQPGWELHAQ